MISIIIPALNEELNLGPLLAGLAGGPDCEVIIVDGGSTDATARIAGDFGARVCLSPPGRGGQLVRGAEEAGGDWLLFLHADCRLPADWWQVLDRHRLEQPEKAMVFSLGLDDDRRRARVLEWIVRWRCRLLALPYGDQGLFISRTLYNALGGFAPLVLMEDVDMVRRIGRRRLCLSSAVLVTSAARYKKNGYLLRMLRNLTCLGLYFIGVPVATLKKLYG